MFERFRNRVLSRGLRRAAGPAPAKRLIVEELEPWILMSADAVPAYAALDGPVTADSEVYELLEQPIATRVELVFIDARVAGDDAVLADLAARAASGAQLEVVVIDSGRDGLEQIDEALVGREDIAALHIVSHGDDGRLQLGAGLLDAAALDARAAELSGWRGALTSDADILLYGCDIGAGAGGLALVQTLSGLTGADVAASDDATGFAARGGDWDLEVQTGAIEADVVFSTAFQQSWDGTLAITTGASTSAATAAAQTSLTFSHTVASGTDRLLIVSAAINSNATITSVTYGGQALTRLGTIGQSAGGGVKTELWYVVAPPQGTANVVVQTAAGQAIEAGATTFFGVDQTTPFGTPATAVGTGNAISGTISSAAGELVIGSVAIRDRTGIANGPGQTSLYAQVASGGVPIYAGAATEAGAASVTMTGTASGGGGAGQWVLLMAAIKPAPSNVAPVLDASRTPVLSPITEDAGAPSGAVGTLPYFSLVDLAVPSGQIDNVTDPDSGALLGVAVTGADTTNGTWWYSTNNGTSWLALGAVSNTNARLLAADGSTRLYFRPNANFSGSIANAITFRAWDLTFGVNGGTANTSINGGSTSFSTASDTASITVTGVNDPPTTTPVTLAPLAEDGGPRLITQAQLIANASDVDGNPLTATGLAIASGAGTLVNNGNGTWTYTPVANDSSSVSFSYTISDGNGGTVAGSATLDLTPVNDPPTTTPVTLAPLAEDGAPRLITQAQLLANASDIEGNPLTATALAIASGGGSLVNNGNGTWTYTPALNDSSSVSFSYTISDGNGGTVAGSASLDLTPVNDPPTTTPVTLAPLAEDGGPRLITQAQLLANATDVDGDALTATALAIVSGAGSLVNNGNGTWTYTPAANDSSSVSFSYTIGDGNGGTVAGSATLDLTPVNDPPTTTPVTLAPLAEDGGPRLITQAQLVANATDVDGDPLTATALAIASGAGSLVNNGNGTWTYTPAANDSSSVSFSYTIGDGNGGTVAGSATLDLTPVNDPPTTTPVTLAPLAEDGAPRLITQAQLLANASDIEGDPLTATALAIASGAGSLVNNGNGTWTYTPAANDSSSVSFSYTISDGNGGTVAGSATLDLTPVNDPPTTTPVTLAPLAEDGGPRLITQAQLLANANDIEGDPLTATALAIASGAGSLVNNGNGTWTYTPALNDSSSVSFSYTISDGNGGTVAGSATLDLTPVNDPPTTTPVTLAPLAEDGAPRLITQAQLLANAGDIEGDPLTATTLAIASGAGTLVDNGNGTWTYTPAANDSSSVSFSYTIGDGNGGTVAGSATLDLTPVNDAPTTTPVTLAPLAEDGGPRLITNAQLIANAADVDGDPLTATGLAIVSGSGTLVDNGNGTWTYTPAVNDSSSVSFSYTIGDGNGGTVAGSATLDLTPVNDPPTTTPVTLAPLAEDGGPRLITNAQLIANAADVDGDALTATALAIVSGGGTLVDNGNGTWTYTPAANDSSSVSFSYTIGDGNGGTVVGSATLDLIPVNDPPTTTPVTLAPLAEDGGPRLITNAQLIANAADVDGDALTATALAIVSGGGTLVDNGNGTWTYTPAANDSTSVAFSYTIGDGNGGSVAGSATLDLTPVNDAPTTSPVTLAPLAEDGGPRLITNAELTANAADIDGDALTASGLAIVSGGGTLVDNGNGTWTYTPAANDSSSISFSYTIGDGNGGSVAGSATLDLTPVNDAPTTTPVTLAPLAEDGGPRLITNAQLIANAADVDGDPLTATGLAIVSGSGTLVDNGNGTWTFTPAANDSSSVSFSYTIGDGNGGTVAGSATLDLTPVNDAPTTTPVTLAPLAEDGGPRLITNAELIASAADIDGDPLTATGLAIASGNGSLVDNGNGTWTYTPAANDSSAVSFSYTIADGNGGSVAGSATLDLTPVNDAPTTAPVILAPLAEDGGPRLITNAELVANAADVEGDTLTATGLAIASGNGSLVDNGNGTWTYTPAANDSSSVSFSYTIGDGNGGTVAGSATLDLTPVNDAPTTTPVMLAPLAEDGGPRLITNAEIVANASDVDGDPLTATALAIATGSGTLVDNGNGTWTYTPAANDSSSVSFSYTIGDGNGGTVAGSATLDLTPVNDAPTTTPVTLAPLAEDGGPRLITNAELIANASDLDGDALTATALAITSGNGALVDNGNGTWTYTPAANDASSVVFSYTIGDGNGGLVAGSATLDLTPVNDAPTTTPVTLAPLAEDGGPRLITNAELITNATDVDGDPLTAAALAIASGSGTLVDNGNGTWTYTATADDSSSVSFSYTIGDGNGGTVAGTATLDLTPVNDAPTTTPVTLAPLAEDGGPRLITNAELTANAVDVDGDALAATGLAIASGGGSVVDNGNGTWTYTPAANDSSAVSFSYTIGDGNGGTVAGSATLDLIPVNDAPTTTPVTLVSLAEDAGPRLITNAELVANASDIDGDALTATGLAIASGNGSLVDNGNGTWTYTPIADDSSSVSFSYTIGDGNGGTVAGTATLDLTPVNDAPTTTPVTLAPLAEDGGPRLITNAELIANAVDVDGDALTATGLAIASGNGALVDNGNGTWTYTPAADDSSAVSFSYTIDDGNGGTLAGSATLDLTPVNDAPTTTPVMLAPLAEDGGPRLITNAELVANAADVDGDPLTATGLAIASGNGSLVDNGNGTWTYTPAANDASSVSFSYTIGDGNGGTVAGSATMDLTPVNDAPTTTPVTLAPLAEDGGPRLITNAELIANAVDVDGDALTATGLAIASGNGALVDNGNGTWTYTPAANDSSAVSFSYTIDDGNGGTVAGSATLDLTPVNDAPTTMPVTLAPLAEDAGPRLITNAELVANASDIDGDALTATGLAIASGNGALVDNGNGTWTYTPAADDSSAVSFSYTIGDGNGGTVAGSATLDLTPVNDAPTTTPVTLAPLAEDGAPRLITNAELIANAADVDGDPLTATALAIVSGSGTLVDNGDGSWTYTPAANDSSSVSFGYTIADNNGGSVAGSATLDLTPVNDAPTTTPVTLAPLVEDGGPRLITNAELVANAIDIDGDPLTASGLAIASGNGALVDNGNGTWTYTPAANDASSVSFGYTIGDGNGGTVAGSATLDLTPVNDAPTTTPVTLAPLAEDGGPRLITNAELIANASDLDGDALTATALAITSGNGALVDNGNGTWTYTPAANDSSSVSFSYTIGDGNGGTVAGSATLDLTPVNDAPTTTPVTLAALAEDGGPRLITNAELVANAIDIDGDPLTASGLAIASGNGTLVDNGNGTWTYTPATNDASSVSFGYTIADGNGGTVGGSATLDLIPVNDAPTTSPVTLAPLVEDGGPRLITNAELVANALDLDGDALTATALAISSGAGTLVDNGNGTWTYTPAANDMSSVSFSYTIADGNGGTVAGSAALDLTPVNDAPTTTPVTLAPLVEDGGPRLITNAELIANATDVDGDPLTAVGLAITSGNGTLVDNGDGTWTYTPAANDSSSVSFSYAIGDGNGGTVVGSATLDLLPANDVPTTSSVTLVPMLEDGGPRLIASAELLVNATDADGDPLVSTGLAIASGGGTLVDNGDGTWSYTPAANYSGPVVFLYTIGDGNGGSVAGSARLDVTPVNDAPVVTSNGGGANANMGVAENTAAVTVVTSLDVDGDTVQYSIIGGADAAHFQIESATGALTFLSPPNYEAPTDGGGDNVYEVVVRAADGQGGSTTQTLQIAVGGVDEAPTVGGDAFDIGDNQLLIVMTTRLLANDADPEGGPLQIVSLTSPLAGTLEQDASGGWRYTPAQGFTGNDRFTYTVADASGRTATAEVVVVVSPLPGGPGGARPTTTLAATESAGASGPLGGAGAANALGGGSLEVFDGTIASGPVDVAGADASAVWTVEAEESPPRDDATADFAAEIERQRVYDARQWAPPDQVELEQIAVDMNGNLLRLAMNMGLQDTSQSLAVFDETFQDMLDGLRRTDREVSEIAIGSGVAVGAGVIAWLLRGGALAASLLSVLPTWASFDPIPILARRQDDEEKPTPPPEDSSEAAVTRVLRPDALPPRQVRS